MRRVALPAELTVPHLLEWQDVASVLRDQFARIPPALAHGDHAAALDLAEHAYEAARHRLDRYAEALALVFRAEICRRQERWEESLDAIRIALHWLELRVAPVTHYNEAVAVYLEGLIHFSLQAELKVTETFAFAQDAFAESERHWGFEQNVTRADDCRNAIRWMAQILEIQASLQPGDAVAILPVYDVVNHTLIRTGAVPLQPFEITLPVELLERYLPPEVLPLQLDTLSFLFMAVGAEPIAVRLPEDGMVPQGQRGDLVIVEVTGNGAPEGELVLTADQAFVRRMDGRVEFRSVSRGATRPAGHVGIPRMLIRGERDHE